MMAAPGLLRAYLESQADLGVDEVILPYPLARSAGPSAADRNAAQESGLHRGPALENAGMPAGRASPDLRPAREDWAGGDANGAPGPSEPVSDSLFANLSQALAEPGLSSRPAAPALRSRPEPAQVPSFPDLGAFWAHLSAHPGLAAGDTAATVTCVVRGQGPAGAPLALAGLEPGEADAAPGYAFQGEPGALLARMLKAIRLDAEGCYRTNLVKAVRTTRPTRRDLVRLVPWLHAELALASAPFVLLLGEACAQAVLKTGKSLDELRQTPFRLEGREFVVTYHPSELLAREELKRKAWEDLQWLQKRMAEAG